MAADTARHKRCTGCGETKPLESFGRCRRSMGGRLPRCSACTRRQGKEWRAAHPEEAKRQQQRYRSANRPKCSAADKRWRQENRARAAEVAAQSRRKHKGTVNAVTAFRAARKKHATLPWLTDKHKAQMREAYEIAALATETLGEPYEVDHIVPLVGKNICGLHVPWNLRVIRAADNRAKGSRFEA